MKLIRRKWGLIAGSLFLILSAFLSIDAVSAQKEEANRNIVLVIDKSGSMKDEVRCCWKLFGFNEELRRRR